MELLIIHSTHDRMIILIAALLLAWIAFGPFKLYRSLGLEKPENLIRTLITKLEGKLNRTRRNASTRIYRGMILVIYMVSMAMLWALLIHAIEQRFAWGQYIELFTVAYLIPARHIWDVSRRGNPLMNNASHIVPLRRMLSSITGRDSDDMDLHTIARSWIEFTAEQFASKLVAPALWYLALGLPALVLVRLIHLLAEQIGHRSARYFAFGWSARHLDTALQFIPSLLASLLLCLAAWFIPRCRPLRAIATLIAHSTRITSPTRRWPVAAIAGALHVTLGGPHRMAGEMIRDGWVGKGTAKATAHDLARAQWLYIAASIVLMLLITSALMWEQKLPLIDFISSSYQSLIGSISK